MCGYCQGQQTWHCRAVGDSSRQVPKSFAIQSMADNLPVDLCWVMLRIESFMDDEQPAAVGMCTGSKQSHGTQPAAQQISAMAYGRLCPRCCSTSS